MNTTNYKKIGKGLLIAMAGAALTYAAEQIPGLNFGQYTVLAVAVFSALVNAGREYLKSL